MALSGMAVDAVMDSVSVKKAIETEFKIHIGNRISRYMDVAYVYQEVDKIPEGLEVPEGRVKP